LVSSFAFSMFLFNNYLYEILEQEASEK